jgi:phosphoribosylformylglycinamidine cyclo-ligase
LPSITYQQSGVDPEKAARILKDFSLYLKKRPRDGALLSGIGPFAACYSLKDILAKYEDPILLTGCDGVGTKAKLALDWDALEGLGQDLVAMNVNDLLCAGGEPVLFLDYYACGQLDEKQLTTILRSIQAGCELSGCTLAGGETAEMPGVYSGEDFDLAGFSIGFGERRHLLGPERVREGDVIVALASSGAHSNGYSLIRKLVDRAGLKPEDTAPFEGGTWKDVLIAPTLIYVPLFKGWNSKVHALAHLTGGGLFENLPRVLPNGMRARIAAWDFPPLFQWIQRTAEISTAEMLSTFNCGVGMLAICPPDVADELVAHARSHKLPAWITGSMEKGAAADASPEVVWE